MDNKNSPQTVVIVGAGPAGLTAAYELITRSDIKPIVLEQSNDMGGIARTINYKGNRMDIGGHRFFSKSQRVMDWWLERMPMQATNGNGSHKITYQNQSHHVSSPTSSGPDPEKEDRVMLLRGRKSRLYFQRKLFDYPISLSPDTILKLGPIRTLKMGFSYLRSLITPIKPENNLEEFFINRFGRELYYTFFKSYTEKVWGVPCHEIDASWGAQRIKGLSITKAILHALKKIVKPKPPTDIKQKETETTLIEQFLYPKFGPGQLWEFVSEEIKQRGGQILTHHKVRGINIEGYKITSLEVQDTESGTIKTISGDLFFSSMPIKELIRDMRTEIPDNVRQVSEGLMYRDFITIGLLVKDLKIKEHSKYGSKLVRDNWIYIQEPDVSIGRLQIFNNWSPYLVKDASKVWLGLEYFCNDTDEIWQWSDAKLTKFASEELEKIGIIKATDVEDSTVIRVPKTYPGYFGTYDRFNEIQEFINRFENLYCVGRNGMHKYNNQDHAMLTAMTAVDNILGGITSKDNIWAVNTEMEYHEEKT